MQEKTSLVCPVTGGSCGEDKCKLVNICKAYTETLSHNISTHTQQKQVIWDDYKILAGDPKARKLPVVDTIPHYRDILDWRKNNPDWELKGGITLAASQFQDVTYPWVSRVVELMDQMESEGKQIGLLHVQSVSNVSRASDKEKKRGSFTVPDDYEEPGVYYIVSKHKGDNYDSSE